MLLLFHRTRALQILIGIVVLLAIYAAAWLLKLEMITYLLGFVFQYGAIALLVVFAPELRAALAHLGAGAIRAVLPADGQREVADEIAEAVERLSRSGIGAIIAIEREVSLDEYVRVRIGDAGEGLGRSADDDLHAVLAAARRRGDHPRRHDRRRGMHPAAVAGVAARSLARHAPPRGARPERGDAMRS